MMIGKNVAIFFQNLLNLGGPELSGIFGLFPISLFYKMKLNKVFENIYKLKFNEWNVVTKFFAIFIIQC